jgi:hypothetical protein
MNVTVAEPCTKTKIVQEIVVGRKCVRLLHVPNAVIYFVHSAELIIVVTLKKVSQTLPLKPFVISANVRIYRQGMGNSPIVLNAGRSRKMVYMNESQIQSLLWLGFALGAVLIGYFAFMYVYVTKRYERIERLLNDRHPGSGDYYRDLRKL